MIKLVHLLQSLLTESTNLWFSGENPTVDNIIVKEGEDGSFEVLLITRGMGGIEPGKLALPGGFIDTSLDEKAERVLISALDNYERYGILYHGTSNNSIVKEVLPPNQTNTISEKGRKKNLDKVFFTRTYKSAEIYAGRSYNSYGGIKRVLPVIPVGRVEILNTEPGTEVFMSDYAIVVDESKPIESQLVQYLKSTMKGRYWTEGAESPKDAALRELKEETGLDIEFLKGRMIYIGEFKGESRDPRDNEYGWTKSYAFGIILPPGINTEVEGSDDASNADWYGINTINFSALAFDHGKILRIGLKKLGIKF